MFSHLPLLVAATPSSEMSFSDDVTYLLTGFGIVMLTLLSLAVVCWLVGLLFRRYPSLAEAGMVKEPAKPAKRSAAPTVGSANGQITAVIGAAVDQALGGRYRIMSVRKLDK